MKLSVGFKLANSLSLTPQLQQAIRLLQLSSLELEQEIQEQLESNPLLDIENDDRTELKEIEKIESQNVSEEIAQEHLPDDLSVDVSWDDIYTHQTTSHGVTDQQSEYEKQSFEQASLRQHIEEQLNLLHLSKIDRVIALCIVDGLDDRGFITEPLEEIAAVAQNLLTTVGINNEVEEDEVRVVLKRIQNLDPVGVASRNVIECLSIQIKKLEIESKDKESALKILENYQYLIQNDLNKLLKITSLSESELKKLLNLIKTLIPYPATGFESIESDYQIPDIVVKKKNNRWLVELNTDNLPKLKVNPFYAGMIRRADQSHQNQYLRTQMLEAKNFIKSVDERHKTLLNVASCIVKYQKEFLEKGAEAMKPLILRDIADEVELHESTVSRVTTNKYILTPQGLFELKYFFSSHVGTSEGGERSSTAIRAIIKKMVSAENPRKPLSDNAISNLLKDQGIEVARRTVAKYRESLNIPSSSERKIII